jgi:hypothetical protein
MFDTNENDIYWELNDSQLVIQGIPNFNDDQIIPIGINIANEGIVTLKIDALENIPNSLEIYLFDNLTNTYYDIIKNEFKIDLAVGNYNKRFSIQFANKIFNTDQTKLEEGIIAYYTNNNQMLTIKNNFMDASITNVILFNIAGQNITHWDIEAVKQNHIQIPIKNWPSGVYIAKIKTSKGDFSKKIILK